ncbi:MAG: YdeI/OmpD-associated family protein [Planctomycetota bacterium]
MSKDTQETDYPRVSVSGAAQLEGWLEKNHVEHGPIWLLTYKKSCGPRYLSKEQISEIAICYGWVDGSPKASGDVQRTMRFFARRRPDSVWSPANKERAESLRSAGRMKPAGLAVVEAAKNNGMWSFLDEANQGIQPLDLVEAFAGVYGSKEGFESFSRSAQILMLRWIKMAKTEKTRANRVEKTAVMAAKGLKAYGS